jgi:hypothetical protein
MYIILVIIIKFILDANKCEYTIMYWKCNFREWVSRDYIIVNYAQ